MNAVTPRFDNSYAATPERFYSRLGPEPVTDPTTIRVNRELAAYLGFDADWLGSPEGGLVVGGNRVPDGATPIASVYAGHQFGHFNPRLGDGRAVLLGEVLATDGQRFDVQLKGSGRTPYSRGGDGRSPLGPVLREYIVSEAMAALGIPTTRSLAAATTGDPVYRERPLPGGVLVRVAQSHIRIGTFEYFASQRDLDGVGVLLEHVLARHYPHLVGAENPAAALLAGVAERLAGLVARWQLIGFVHGVMNTDNMLVSGETIDYGPCAFMEAYDPTTVFSSIDHQGRYAYGNQARIAQWNIAALAQALLPLIGPDPAAVALAQEVVDGFPDHWQATYRAGLAQKLGLSGLTDNDDPLVDGLLETMKQTEADFTNTWRRLANEVEHNTAEAAELGGFGDAFTPWLAQWRQRMANDDPVAESERAATMRSASPVFIPRNHQVEAAISEATDAGTFYRFHRLVDVLRDPFTFDPVAAELARPARPDERVCQTFCGT